MEFYWWIIGNHWSTLDGKFRRCFSNSVEIEEVERLSDESDADIEALIVVNIDCIRMFWVNEIQFQTLIQEWIKWAKKEIRKNVIEYIFQIELQLEYLKPELLTKLMDIHAKWKQHFMGENLALIETEEPDWAP